MRQDVKILLFTIALFAAVTRSVGATMLTAAISGNGTLQSSPVGINCPNTCSFDFPPGTSIVISALPGAGAILSGWSDCDTAFGLECRVDIATNARNPVATFTASSTVVPDAPVIGSASSGNTLAQINFVPGANGGAAIDQFIATCVPGPIVARGLSSPIVVYSLSNGTTYNCTVMASNAAGTSAPSMAASVVPGTTPLALIGAKSRKTHGIAGTFDIPIDRLVSLGGNVTVESRLGPTHSIILDFNGPVNAPGNPTATDSRGLPVGIMSGATLVRAAGIGTWTTLCCSVNVLVSDAGDSRRVNLSLAGVNGNVNTAVAMGFLAGDANSTGAVNAADVSAVKVRSSQTATTANYRADVNASGKIDSGDITIVKAHSGQKLPAVLNPPTMSLCYAQSGAVVISGSNFVNGVTTLSVNGLPSTLSTVTSTSLTAQLPSGVAAGVATVIITVAGTGATATGNCNVSLAPPVTYSIEGSVIPAFTKFANAIGAIHAGANGANGDPRYQARQNAWAVSPAGLCNNTTPAITRVWYHNLDYTGYTGGNANAEYFGILANEALVYSFIAPPEGARGSLQLNESTIGILVANFVTISTQPCDFNVAKLNDGSGCYNTRSGPNTTSYFSTVGAGNLFECKLTPGMRYYLNYRNQEAAGAPTSDSCQSSGATWCGGLFTLR